MEKGAHLVVRGFLIFCGKNAHSDSQDKRMNDRLAFTSPKEGTRFVVRFNGEEHE